MDERMESDKVLDGSTVNADLVAYRRMRPRLESKARRDVFITAVKLAREASKLNKLPIN